jgi:DNA replication protein DnaC
MRQESIPALERRLKRYTQMDLLILDENGYLANSWRAERSGKDT